MFEVKTKGRIVGLHADLMKLLSNDDGAELVSAARTDGTWTVSADGHDDATADNRPDAITAMVEHAQAVTGADNYTAQSAPGLHEQP